MALTPDRAIIMGGSWRIPVLAGLQDASYIQEMKRDETFDQAAFDREMESKWSGTSDGAYFNGDAFDANRILEAAEYQAEVKATGNNFYYIMGVDVGRKNDDTVVTVLKVRPQRTGPAIKNLVNIYSIGNKHFELQAIDIKRIFYKFRARALVLDANGLGIGLLDEMVRAQDDKLTGEHFPPFGVINDDDGDYKSFKTKDMEMNAIYQIKANAPLNTEAHSNLQTHLISGKLKLLIDDRVAKVKLDGSRMGKNMRPEERDVYLAPYKLTSILKLELMNLRQKNEGVNIILERANRSIHKDKVSSLEYALWYIRQTEDMGKKRKRFSAKDFMFIS